jgi:hypothetical protein
MGGDGAFIWLNWNNPAIIPHFCAGLALAFEFVNSFHDTTNVVAAVI